MKLTITPKCATAPELVARHISLAPECPDPKGSGALAIVGGGLSLRKRLDTLAAWDGEIWAINGTFQWLLEHGIESTFYTIDPGVDFDKLIVGAKKVVLGIHCDPLLFKRAREANAEISTIKKDIFGVTSAVAAIPAAIAAGYRKVVFFGCEGSFSIDEDHVWDTEGTEVYLEVECGGCNYLTKPEWVLQTEQLSALIRRFPKTLEERSEGFLKALIKYKEYNPVRYSPALVEKMDIKYEWALVDLTEKGALSVTDNGR